MASSDLRQEETTQTETSAINNVKILLNFDGNSNLKCNSFENLATKLQILKNAPNNEIFVIADYDNTITSYFLNNGEKCPSAYKIVCCSQLIGETFREKASALEKYYLPLEISHDLTESQKEEILTKWWETGNENLVASKISRESIGKCVINCEINLRSYVDEFLKILHSNEIPCLVFSAGISVVIEEVFLRNNLLFNNINIISNRFEFDNNGIISGALHPAIHSYNKNGCILNEYPEVMPIIEKKRYVILLGDSIGDANMAECIPKIDSVLKIGFLNVNVLPRLDLYCNTFDIVILNDTNMKSIVDILNYILT